MIDLTGNVFLKGFFDSLLPYADEPKKLTAKIAELKTFEAIELLLQSGDAYRKLLFDFQEPHKIILFQKEQCGLRRFIWKSALKTCPIFHLPSRKRLA